MNMQRNLFIMKAESVDKASSTKFIQSIVFPKSSFTLESAKEWLLKNGFDSTLKSEQTSDSFIFHMDERSSFGDLESMDLLPNEGIVANVGPKIKRKYSWDMTRWHTSKQQDKRIVTGIVMEPNVVDTDREFVSAETIERAAHKFMEHHQFINLDHLTPAPEISIIESFIQREETTMDGQPVKSGSWIMAVKVNDDVLWASIKAGDFKGFSMEGTASLGG